MNKALARFTRTLAGSLTVACIGTVFAGWSFAHAIDSEVNLASVAEPSSSHVSGDTSLAALHDGHAPESSHVRGRGSYGNWPSRGTQWVQYEWSQPIGTQKIDVYWWDDHRGVRLPKACRLLWWDGNHFVPVRNPSGFGTAASRYNSTTFDEVRTSKLRLEIDGDGNYSTGILEWKVYDSGNSPDFPPSVTAGDDRVVVLGGQTYLDGVLQTLRQKDAAKTRVAWSKVSGPGTVDFADVNALATTATFHTIGDYELRLTAVKGPLDASSALTVKVVPAPPPVPLELIDTGHYKIDSPLWNHRAKALIVHWIPHCIEKISDPDLPHGGINNFVETANKLAGKPHEKHRGYAFSNAWVYNTIEAISVALMVDPQGDAEMIAAQQSMRATLEDWIPQILAAQESDGYIQTFFTLSDREHWSPENRGAHEGYVAGYFLEAAVAHYMLSSAPSPLTPLPDGERGNVDDLPGGERGSGDAPGGERGSGDAPGRERGNRTPSSYPFPLGEKGNGDTRLYDAAKRLADCWCDNIGPAPKKTWYDGHQAMEIGLVRFGRFVNQVEGEGRGDKYIALAKFLLDCRDGGYKYDQSHVPVVRQYEAVGHAVRASYSYAGMADVALRTGDVDYQSAVMSLWDNIVHKKYYVTGGIGSGETAEGFGPNYSLRHNAYCESCSSCGEIHFQHKLNLTYHDAKYADLYEETLYNALLGSIDIEGKNFYYQNPLVTSRPRYDWHACPCCVGNIPRILLMLPTWMYAKSDDSLYVNLFVGGTVTVKDVAGTDVEVVQKTDYPWSGNVSITVNPASSTNFHVKIRVPNRDVSDLYHATPNCDGITSISVNGSTIDPPVKKGYAMIRRKWKAGDRIDLVLPMNPQRVKGHEKIAATRGQVALRRGPLLYAAESLDQDLEKALDDESVLSPEWRDDLLGGVMVLKGEWADGSRLTAIPYYARNNRAPVEPAAKASAPQKDAAAKNGPRAVQSTVWLKEP